MNNQQFRRLVLDTPAKTNSHDDGSIPGSDQNFGATPVALGSRMRSSIPMTPRSLGGNPQGEFARQVAERNSSLQPATKKFRSSAAPKGTKLGAGYIDRTQARVSTEEDGKASRIKALEDMVRLGQMEYSAFENLRDEIVGGDVQNVHLVKGLDRKLLERVRRGEDVLAAKPKEDVSEDEGGPKAVVEEDKDVDQELDELEAREVKPVAKEEKVKKGEMAPTPPVAGKKRTRDEILAEFRASRLAPAKAPEPSLGSKFSKIGQGKQTSRVERDDRGREVLITVDEQGKVKRKVKKSKSAGDDEKLNGLLTLDKDVTPLGMDVTPVQQSVVQEEEDDDIFEGAGADYDPLADLDEDTDDSKDVDEGRKEERNKAQGPASEAAATRTETSIKAAMPPPPAPSITRNYFSKVDNSAQSPPSSSTEPVSLTKDPSLLAALKKASAIAAASTPDTSAPDGTSTEEEAAKLARRRAMLSPLDRDAEDLDMGFGASQFGDDVDDEGNGKSIKLSQWRPGGDDNDSDEKSGRGGKQRKRGKKKRLGDKNSAADVLRVMEGRKQG